MEPPASILKPPGSIVEPPGLQPSFAYASHIQQHHLANVGQSLAWGSFLLCFGLPQQPCQSVGGGGVPPWGPSIRRPPKVCEACWTIITSPFRYVQIKSQRANLKGQAHYARPGSCSPLFFSPQEAGDHRSPPLNLHVLRLVGLLGLIFCSSDTLFKNDIEKT